MRNICEEEFGDVGQAPRVTIERLLPDFAAEREPEYPSNETPSAKEQ
jgi:hypothetical protein